MDHSTSRQSAARRHTRNLHRPAGTRLPAGPDLRSAGPREIPRIVTVFRGNDGVLRHARCTNPLVFHGTRGEIEVDFYCVHCVAHVTLPLGVLNRIPIAGS